MRRREFITLLCGTAIANTSAVAQSSERMPRIGVLIAYSEKDPEGQSRIGAFRSALQALGWEEGRNLTVDYRWPAGDPKRIREDAAELVSLAPTVIASVGTPVTAALQQATSTIPVVFLLVIDPVASKFVANLSNPGGNITGFTNYEHGMGGKWLELLREAAPGLRRTLLVFNPNNAGAFGILRTIESAAPSFGINVTSAPVHGPAEIERVFHEFSNGAAGGLVVVPDALLSVHRKAIIHVAAQHRIPAIYPFRFFAEEGGLLSYGVDALELFRRSASYVDRILRGAKPADLPVQAPTKFELVINMKTAKALGIDVPPSLLIRADEVIE